MAPAREWAQRLARENARPFARAWYRRVFAMVLSVLAGWLGGCVFGSLAFELLIEFRASEPGPWETALFASTLGCALAFPSLLVWLALFLRSSSPLARLEVAPVFGTVCGLAIVALVLADVRPHHLSLPGEQALSLYLLGAAAGATTWTTYVLLARRIEAPTRPSRDAD